MMNIPQGRKGDIMKEVAEKIREAIIPTEGYELGEFDWKAIEALLLGYFAGDEEYMIASKLGIHDIYGSHILVHRGLLDKPKTIHDPDVISGEWGTFMKKNHDWIRYMAKKKVYSGSYGQGAFSMARDLQCTVAEAKELDTIFAKMAPKIIKWQADTRLRAHEEGRLMNPFGYVMTFFEVYTRRMGLDGELVWVPGKEANECLAFNPQSTCAAMLRETLVTLGNDPEEGSTFRLLVPTHDSISFEIKLGQRDYVMRKIGTLMAKKWDELGGLSVDVEGKVGMSFKEMKIWKG
jgi:DNA polymerase I-like protein with 3'-5' exonuclease and polymerase domains